MRIAVAGCVHGELDTTYKTLQDMEKKNNYKIDLLLCCGDFEAVRNENDLKNMNAPKKYQTMNSFWKYYSGLEIAPILTIFIGGNHEASNYMWELYYGGWAAPNIYFLGFAGVIKFGNIRIGGLSGIYNPRNYHLGHFERPPYNKTTISSVYHVREYDVHKLLQVEEQIDIFLSHDWPLCITDYGNWKELVRHKPHLTSQIQDRILGSEPAAKLLKKLKPSYWFSAHMHCEFSALVQHGKNGPSTRFLALDKCLPGRKYLQVLEIESAPGPYEIEFDEEWLAITRKLNSSFPLTSRRSNLIRSLQVDVQECRQWVRSRLGEKGAKPFEFARTAPCYNPSESVSIGTFPENPRNPQTVSLLEFLELPYLLGSASEDKEEMYHGHGRGRGRGNIFSKLAAVSIEDKEERTNKSVSITSGLSGGEMYLGGRGHGGGHGWSRGGFRSNIFRKVVASSSIEDAEQFPSLGGSSQSKCSGTKQK
ncbi:hypothetical protein LWI29_027689 [Acer saccharum]|uniref:Lariat debranching enzyme C-terminal domain-containing protein n=1 Tax=Acer saccharum TaxID=4024 RepID=A0AA39RJX6_ACESA|nr:hypothetical protein LWI29_027689 [Acer saccharum]KAK1553017.1 hypothetical protein Q3G72_027232 [Acer saccharum]